MITESLDSLLLEVNATPDMAYSTPVTKQICPECLRDVIKGTLPIITVKLIFLNQHFLPQWSLIDLQIHWPQLATLKWCMRFQY